MNQQVRLGGAIVLSLSIGAAAIAAPAQGYYTTRFYQNRLQPLSRAGFHWVNYSGGGVDPRGYYRRPVRSIDAFGAELPTGWNYAPMQFDDQGNAALYYVERGYITRQDYSWHWGVQ